MMAWPIILAKVLRRLHLSGWLDIVVPMSSSDAGTVLIPLQRGLTESLLSAHSGGFKSDLCRWLQARDLFPGIICDVGMNMGQTLIEICAAGPKMARYYGFEPNASAMAIVERLMELNPQLNSIQLMPWACSSHDAPSRFFAISETDSGATLNPSIRPDWYQYMAGTMAASYRLDTAAELMQLCRHFFLKVDVEGGELDVLRGGSDVLKQWRPIIQCEVLHAHRPSELAANDEHKAAIQEFLMHHSYALMLCCLSADGRRLHGLKPLEAFPSAVYADSPHTCDYLFVPQELVARLLT